MNLNIIHPRCVLFFIIVIIVGIQSRSVMKRAAFQNASCVPEEKLRSIRVPTCQTRTGVPVKRCKGKCISYAIPSSSGVVAQTCNCCRTLVKEIITVELFCKDNGRVVTKYHDIESAKKCSCVPC